MSYEYYEERGWAAGTHKLEFASGSAPGEGAPIRQLCNVRLHEYKNEDEGFRFDNDYVGLYRTWRQNDVFAGYRPTNELCLMRNMTSTSFCAPCREGMWMQFFMRMSLIDGVQVEVGALLTTFQ